MRLTKRQEQLLRGVYEHAPDGWTDLWSNFWRGDPGGRGFHAFDMSSNALLRKGLVEETAAGIRLTVTGSAVLQAMWRRDDERSRGGRE